MADPFPANLEAPANLSEAETCTITDAEIHLEDFPAALTQAGHDAVQIFSQQAMIDLLFRPRAVITGD